MPETTDLDDRSSAATAMSAASALPGQTPPIAPAPIPALATGVELINGVSVSVAPRHRERSALDVLRLLMGLALLGVGLVVSTWGRNTILGAEADIVLAYERLPDRFAELLNGLAWFTAAILPTLALVALVVTLHFQRAAALFVGGTAALLAMVALDSVMNDRSVLDAVELQLGRPIDLDSRNFATSPLLASVVAMVVIASSWLPQRWRRALWAAVVVLTLLRVVSSGQPPLDLVMAVALGMALGSLALVVFGAPSADPDGAELVEVLHAIGHPARIEQISLTSPLCYLITMEGGRQFDLRLHTPHDRSADLLDRLWRYVRLRSIDNDAPFSTPSRRTEHEALALTMAGKAGARVRDMQGLVVTPGGCVGLLVEHVPAVVPGDDPAAPLGRPQLVEMWRQVALLHRRRIAHRSLSLGRVSFKTSPADCSPPDPDTDPRSEAGLQTADLAGTLGVDRYLGSPPHPGSDAAPSDAAPSDAAPSDAAPSDAAAPDAVDRAAVDSAAAESDVSPVSPDETARSGGDEVTLVAEAARIVDSEADSADSGVHSADSGDRGSVATAGDDVEPEVLGHPSTDLADRNSVVLDGFDRTRITATERDIAVDVAQLLVDTSLRVGPALAVDAAIAGRGRQAVVRAVPFLQPPALPGTTRRALRAQRSMLDDIRAVVQEVTGGELAPLTRLDRIRPRTAVSIVALTAALYALLPQLATADETAQAARSANWWWLAPIVVGSMATYFFAALAFTAAAPGPLPLLAAIRLQIASSFVSQIAPANTGGLAAGVRFLQRAGFEPAAATTAVGLNAIGGLAIHLSLMFAFIAWTGTSGVGGFSVPEANTLLLIVAVVIPASGLVIGFVPSLRRRVGRPLIAHAKTAVATLATVVTDPLRVLQLLTGATGITMTYTLTLAAAIQAFGGGLSLPQVGAAYLVAAALASVAPTPGGLGALEAALVAALTGYGMADSRAISAVLLFRLATFWLPVLPGYLTFQQMQRRGEL
jgi:uncharacterized membrane protein YbhN (UPF0104 family)